MMPRIAKVINALAANKCNGQEKKINSIRFSLNMQRKPIEWLWKSNSMLNGGSIPQRKLSHSLSFSLTTILREINRTKSGGWHLLAYKVIINLCYFYLSLLQSNLLARRIKRLEISQSVNIIARCISEFIPFNLVHSQLPHNFASVYEESTVYGGGGDAEVRNWSKIYVKHSFRFFLFRLAFLVLSYSIKNAGIRPPLNNPFACCCFFFTSTQTRYANDERDASNSNERKWKRARKEFWK